MENKDLINKLENTELPDIKMPIRKNWLGRLLLKTKAGTKIPGLSGRFALVINNVKRVLVSRYPIWRVAMASVLVIALISGISLSIPLTAGEPKEDIVMEILQNDSEFMKIFGEEIEEIEIKNGISYNVAVSGEYARFKLTIDFSTETINSYRGNRNYNFTDEEKAIILQVLNTNSKARSLLDRGAAIDYRVVSYRSYPFQNSALENETTAAASIAIKFDIPQQIEINGVNISEDHFSLWVDLVHEESSPLIHINYGCMNEEELAEVIEILRVDYRTSTLLDDGVIIDVDKYEGVQVNISKDVGVLNPNPDDENANVEIITIEKLVSFYFQVEDKYYRADVDVVNRSILWFGEVEEL